MLRKPYKIIDWVCQSETIPVAVMATTLDYTRYQIANSAKTSRVVKS